MLPYVTESANITVQMMNRTTPGFTGGVTMELGTTEFRYSSTPMQTVEVGGVIERGNVWNGYNDYNTSRTTKEGQFSKVFKLWWQ